MIVLLALALAAVVSAKPQAQVAGPEAVLHAARDRLTKAAADVESACKSASALLKKGSSNSKAAVRVLGEDAQRIAHDASQLAVEARDAAGTGSRRMSLGSKSIKNSQKHGADPMATLWAAHKEVLGARDGIESLRIFTANITSQQKILIPAKLSTFVAKLEHVNPGEVEADVDKLKDDIAEWTEEETEQEEKIVEAKGDVKEAKEDIKEEKKEVAEAETKLSEETKEHEEAKAADESKKEIARQEEHAETAEDDHKEEHLEHKVSEATHEVEKHEVGMEKTEEKYVEKVVEEKKEEIEAKNDLIAAHKSGDDDKIEDAEEKAKEEEFEAEHAEDLVTAHKHPETIKRSKGHQWEDAGGGTTAVQDGHPHENLGKKDSHSHAARVVPLGVIASLLWLW